MRAVGRQLAYWLALLVACSAFTWASAFGASAADPTRAVALPLALGFAWQLPFALVLALALGALEVGLERVSPRFGPGVAALVVGGATVAVVTFYVSSQVVHNQLDAFVDLAAFRTAATDTRQMVQYAWHDAPAALLGGVALFAAAPTAYAVGARRARRSAAAARPKAVATVGATLAGLALAATVAAATLGDDALRATWYHSYPTVYAARAAWDATRAAGAQAAVGEFGQPLVELDAWADANPLLGRGPDVFLIVLESVGADHLGFNGYARPDVTPHLDRLASESIAFVTAYAPSNHSNYAQTSILSSQYPRRTRELDYYETIDYPKVLLFDVLAAHGYETAVISSQDESWQGMRRFYTTGSRIDHFLDATQLAADHRAGVSAHDDRTRERAEAFLRGRDRARPVFVYMNFQSTHFDYRIPDDAPRPYQPDHVDFPFAFWRYPRSKVGVVLNRYDNALRYADAQLGAFLSFLRAEGLYDDAIVAVASDHGEAFYRQGLPTHGSSLYDDQVRTFFTLKLPHARVRGLRADAVSLVDVAPTILDAMGLAAHPNFQGRSVLEPADAARSLYLTSQGVTPMDAVVRYPWKLIRRRAGRTKLVNVETEPRERRDLASAHPDVAAELSAELERFIATQLAYYDQDRKATYPPRW